MILFKLAWVSLLKEKGQLFTAAFGVAAAVGLLVWHCGLAETAVSQSEKAAIKATTPFDAWIQGPSHGPKIGKQQTQKAPTNGKRAIADQAVGFRRGGSRAAAAPIPQELFEAVASSPTVKSTLELQVAPIVLDIRPGGHIIQGPPMTAQIAVIPESAKQPFAANELVSGEWVSREAKSFDATVSYAVFEQRKLPIPEVGSTINLITQNRTLTLRIVGLYKYSNLVAAFPSIYTTEFAYKEITGKASPQMIEGDRGNLLLCEMADGLTGDALEEVLDTVPQAADKCTFTTVSALRDRFESDTVGQIRAQLPLSLTLAFITAVCMMTTVLVSSITEQRKRIAMLRCIGMTRKAAAGVILTETLIIALIGWIIGLVLALLALQCFLFFDVSEQLPKLVHITFITPLYSLALCILVCMFATIAPAIHAIKIAPLEAIAPIPTTPSPISKKKISLGIILLLPLFVMGLPFAKNETSLRYLMIAIGMPCFTIGCWLLIHPIMRFVEFCFLPFVAWCIRLDKHMLARRLSREPARAVGTIMTLSFGLCSFIAIHIWGGTLMSSYVPSPEWPDAIVSALPGGLTKEQVEQGNKATGLGRNLIPIECTQFPLDKSTCKKIEANGGSSDGQVLIFGVDPQKAFGENKPFANFKFSNGNAALAAIELTKGDTCIVPDMFLRLTGLKVGDTISLAGKELRICGSVNLNWHLVTSRAQVRTLNGRLDKKEKSQKSAASPKSKRTMGMIFTSENTARELTGNFDRINFLWAELSEELKSIHPLQATVRLDEALRGTMKPSNESVLKVHHRDEIADGTVAHGNDIIGTMARIPFWSLIVTSAGIIALLIASAKASQKELRTMRAVGMTQGQVMRLFAGEAMLIIICMLIISFFGGMLIGWSFTACTRLAMRAGLAVTLVIPWLTVLKGICFATFLCIIMSALPLRSIAK